MELLRPHLPRHHKEKQEQKQVFHHRQRVRVDGSHILDLLGHVQHGLQDAAAAVAGARRCQGGLAQAGGHKRRVRHLVAEPQLRDQLLEVRLVCQTVDSGAVSRWTGAVGWRCGIIIIIS